MFDFKSLPLARRDPSARGAAVGRSGRGLVAKLPRLPWRSSRGTEVQRAEAAAANAASRLLLTLLFTDIVESTQTAERLGDEGWRALLARHHAIVRAKLALFRGQEVDKAGDGFFATFERPGLAVCCAEAIRAALEEIGICVRAGIHAGECDTFDGEVTGVAVHVAARVASIAQPGEILVSSSLRDLLAGSGFEFADRDWHALKGLSGTRQLFALNGRQPVTTASS
jgi:class 3 adenylate cyclase